MRSWVDVGALLGFVLSIVSCGSSDRPACTTIGCDPDPTFDVLIRPDKAALDAGDYVVTVTSDVGNATLTCTVTPTTGTCDGTTDVIRAGVRTNSAGAAAYIVVSVIGPSEVSLTLASGETELATQDFAPKKTDFQPNGTGCGPVCEVFASDKLTY